MQAVPQEELKEQMQQINQQIGSISGATTTNNRQINQ